MQIDREALTRLREGYPLTKTELAHRVGVSRNAIWYIESGRTAEPRPATIRKIVEVLGVDVDALRLRVAA